MEIAWPNEIRPVGIKSMSHSSFNPRKLRINNAMGRSSDLLPSCPVFPSGYYQDSDHINGRLVMELTAAGQSQIYTVFPFNSR